MECLPLLGCSCSGAVCSELFATKAGCDAAHSDCPLCGTVMEIECGEGEFCRPIGVLGRCTFLDELWGICVPVPESCEVEHSPVCACDGVTYENPCLARAAQQTLASRGACQP